MISSGSYPVNTYQSRVMQGIVDAPENVVNFDLLFVQKSMFHKNVATLGER